MFAVGRFKVPKDQYHVILFGVMRLSTTGTSLPDRGESQLFDGDSNLPRTHRVNSPVPGEGGGIV